MGFKENRKFIEEIDLEKLKKASALLDIPGHLHFQEGIRRIHDGMILISEALDPEGFKKRREE